jgi:hypothetical protein
VLVTKLAEVRSPGSPDLYRRKAAKSATNPTPESDRAETRAVAWLRHVGSSARHRARPVIGDLEGPTGDPFVATTESLEGWATVGKAS